MSQRQALRPLERRIVRLLEEGLDEAEIADRFRRSPDWVLRVAIMARVPRTQTLPLRGDVLRPLERLGIATGHVAFVPADFAVDGVAAAVVEAGLDPQVPSLFLGEGVAVYLDRPVLESLLNELGVLACNGSRLAISLSVASGSQEQAARRARFQAAVAAMGEPARTVLTADEAGGLFESTGWKVVPRQERARAVGFVVVEPAPR